MNKLATLYELFIFEQIPKEQRTAGKTGWWNTVQRRYAPYALTRSTLFTTDGVLLFVAGLIGYTTHAPIVIIVNLEIFYLGACVLLILARVFKQPLSVIGLYLAVAGVGILLNLAFPNTWGSVLLYLLCVTVLYRFSLEWSLPLAGVCILALIMTDGSLPPVPMRSPGYAWTLLATLTLSIVLCWVGWSRRTQLLLIMRLQQTQAMLREQMIRGEELAAERERTRIARDIHDVLSHSLAVLSIQVQAARNLRTRDPERLAAKLDDMAVLIRESITESRRVVGLLREKPPHSGGPDDLSTRLRIIANTFNERTGIHCRFEERGTPHKVGPQQQETLELALREMLTNAHRHGAAQTVWITIHWQEANIILEAHDDGKNMETMPPNVVSGASTSEVADSGHHGLQGMRERAATLGGEVEAGPMVSGGFRVSMNIPCEPSNKKTAWKGKEA